MALAKATIEALAQMAETLRQSADDILVTKEQMDSELRSFLWDDPIGMNFISRYEEDFKPLKEKLIPNIKSYITHIMGLEGVVESYSESIAAAIGAAGVAGGAGIAKFAQNKGDGVVRSAPLKGFSEKEIAVMARDGIISDDEDPANVDLSEEDYSKLSATKAYKKRYEAYLAELRKRKPNFAEGISDIDIDKINSAVFDLKEDELVVSFEKLGKAETLGGQAEGEWAQINDAFLDRHPDRSICGIGALGAHESSHTWQWKIFKEIYDKAQTDPESLTKREKVLLKTFPKKYSGWSQAYHNSPEERDARISQYAFRDACNQYVLERYYSKEKP